MATLNEKRESLHISYTYERHMGQSDSDGPSKSSKPAVGIVRGSEGVGGLGGVGDCGYGTDVGEQSWDDGGGEGDESDRIHGWRIEVTV